MRGWLYCDIIFSPLAIFGEGVIISWHYIFTPGNIWWGGDYTVTLYFHPWQYLVIGWSYRDIIFSLLTIFDEGVIISWHYIFIPWHSPRIWHWRWLYLNIFTIQIWLCSDTRVLPFIYIYSPHETWGLKWTHLSMIPSLLLKLSLPGGYVAGFYQQFVMNKNL